MATFTPRTSAIDSIYGDVFNSHYNQGSYNNDQDCLPNCTAYAQGRAIEATGTYESFWNWQRETFSSLSQIRKGDVLWGNGHAGFVESIGAGPTIYVSGSAYTTENGKAHNGFNGTARTWGGGTYPLDNYPKTVAGVEAWAKANDSDYYGSPGWGNRIFRYGLLAYASWNSWTNSGGGIERIYHNPNGDSSAGNYSPTNPPYNPPEPSRQKWRESTRTVEQTILKTRTFTYSVIFECGDDSLTFHNKGGTQDKPSPPLQMTSDSSDRIDERWEPFNMYTYERTLTYYQDKSPNWSNWDLKYEGSENFSMGSQPSNPENNGWKMSWDGSPSPTPGPTPPGPTPEPDDYQYYDAVIEMPESKELDFLYTADIHAGWNNYGGNRWPSSHMFSLDTDQVAGKSLVGGDVKAYQNKLIAAGIPTYLLDCGDWSKGANYQGGDESTCVNRTIEILKGMNYFGITTGNWEWKWDISTAFSYLNSMKNYGLMACNVNDSNGDPLFPGGRHPDFPGCKAIKVGDKKIALIAVGYPSPNGYDTYGTDHVEYNGTTYRWNYKENGSTRYRWFDSSDDASLQQNGTVNPSAGGSVYRRVQGYIDQFKNTYGFDYIIVFSHLDKYSDENYSDDDRFFSRADFLIKNTSGINVVIPGHLNAPIENTYTYSWKNGSGSGIIAPEAGGEMNSFGRLRINLETNKISFKLLKSLNDIRSA